MGLLHMGARMERSEVSQQGTISQRSHGPPPTLHIILEQVRVFMNLEPMHCIHESSQCVSPGFVKEMDRDQNILMGTWLVVSGPLCF